MAQVQPLAAPRLKLMPAAIEARLRLGFPESHFQFDLMPYALTLEEFGRTVKRIPFLGLGFSGIAPDRGNGRFFQGKAKWTLILVTRNAQSAAARFLGDGLGAGLFEMIDAAAGLLQGADIADIGPATITAIDATVADGWTEDGTVLASVDFEIAMNQPLTGIGNDPGLLEALSMQWRFDPIQTADGYGGRTVDETVTYSTGGP